MVDATKLTALATAADEHLAALKAATDPLAWLLLMHDSERRFAEAVGLTPERTPYLEAAEEIKRLRALTEAYLKACIEEKMLANHPPVTIAAGALNG